MTDSLPAAGPAPVDLEHLRRQSGGDLNLEHEVLSLFLSKSESDLARILNAGTPDQRRAAAHSLVGSARAVGAVAVAKLAAGLEQGGGVQASTDALRDALAAAQAFIRAHLRAAEPSGMT